jgi:hypothetical protein
MKQKIGDRSSPAEDKVRAKTSSPDLQHGLHVLPSWAAFHRFPLALVLCCQETRTKQMDKRENYVTRIGVRARQRLVSSGRQSAEPEKVWRIYCINIGAVSGIWESVKNSLYQHTEPCGATNSGMFPILRMSKGDGCPRTPIIWGMSEGGGHQWGGSLSRLSPSCHLLSITNQSGQTDRKPQHLANPTIMGPNSKLGTGCSKGGNLMAWSLP